MGQRASTGLTTFNTFWVYLTPLIGAWIADTYWGRYKTVCVAVVIATIGHIILIIAAIPNVLDNQKGALACFIIAILVMGAGTGVFKSNISPLVAEQYRKNKMFIKTQKNGERVIVDPTLTASRIYMVSATNLHRHLHLHLPSTSTAHIPPNTRTMHSAIEPRGATSLCSRCLGPLQ